MSAAASVPLGEKHAQVHRFLKTAFQTDEKLGHDAFYENAVLLIFLYGVVLSKPAASLVSVLSLMFGFC